MEKPYYRRISKKEFQGMVKDLTGKSIEHGKVKKVLKEAGVDKLKYRSSLSKREAVKAIEGIKKVVTRDIKAKKPGTLRGKFDFRKKTAKQIYEKKTSEFAKAEKPTGPTKEDIKRQKRKEEALKVFHKRERAEEVKAEKEAQESGQAKPADEPAANQPVSIQGGATQSASGAQGQGAQTGKISTRNIPQDNRVKNRSQAPTLAVLPFSNISTEPELNKLGSKISSELVLRLSELPGLDFIESDKLEKILTDWEFDPNRIANDNLIEKISKVTRADYVLVGEFQKFENEIQFTARIFEKDINKINRIPKVAGDYQQFSTLLDALIKKIKDFFIEKPAGPTSPEEENAPSQPEDLWID